MYKKRIFRGVLLSLLIFANLMAGPNTNANLEIDYDIYTEMVDNEIPDEGIESEIVIAIIANNVKDLDGYSFLMEYDPEVLSFVWAKNKMPGINNTPFLESQGGKLGAFIVKTNKNSIDIASSMIGKNPNESPDGKGVLAYLKFKRVNIGDGKIRLKDVHFIDSFMNLDKVVMKHR